MPYKSCGHLSRRKLGPRNFIRWFAFSTTSRLNGEYLRKETCHRKSGMALETTKWPVCCSNISRTLVRKRRKMGLSYLPARRKCRVLLLCQPSQSEVTEQNSTKLCDMLGSEPDLHTRIKNWRSSLPQNWGAKTAYFVTVFNSTKLCQMPKNRIGVLPSVNACYDYRTSGIRWRRIANVNDAWVPRPRKL